VQAAGNSYAASAQNLLGLLFYYGEAEHNIGFPSLLAVSSPLLSVGEGIVGMQPFHPRRQLTLGLDNRFVQSLRMARRYRHEINSAAIGYRFWDRQHSAITFGVRRSAFVLVLVLVLDNCAMTNPQLETS
jgi:hypothetical protein